MASPPWWWRSGRGCATTGACTRRSAPPRRAHHDGMGMIFYAVTERHAYTMRSYLQSWGQHLLPHIHLFPYERLLEPMELKVPPGTWIFSDVDRLPPALQEAAIRVRDRLVGVPGRF